MNQGPVLFTNTPNFLGMLFDTNVHKTQFLSAIGGAEGGNALITTNPEFPLTATYTSASPTAQGVSENDSMGAAKPTYFTLSQTKNVIQIFTEDVTISNFRERATGRLQGINTAGAQPERTDELAWQIMLHLEKIKRNLNYTALNGKFSDAGLSDSAGVMGTRGLLEAIVTNVVNKEVATPQDYVAGIDEMVKKLYDTTDFAQPTLVVNSTDKVKISENYRLAELSVIDRNRYVAGINVQEIVTNFGKSLHIIVDNDVPENTVIIADLSKIRPVFTRDVTTGEVISVKAAPQRNGQAVNIYCEFGLDYGAEQNHAKFVYTAPAKAAKAAK